MERVGAISHTTFGDRSDETEDGVDRDEVTAWAQGVAAYLRAHPYGVGHCRGPLVEGVATAER
jgi:hypothetical protein